jgi:hypothetical protein
MDSITVTRSQVSHSSPVGPRTVTGSRLAPPGLALLPSVFAWIVLFADFSPIAQNFPLNDDWAFANGTFLFARGQGIHYGNWASMPQLGQWLWACPFLWVLGESHFALRVATIVLSWLGLAAFYDLLRQQHIAPKHAAMATGTLAVNPLFFLLQGTFMTDVPSLSFAMIALALYGRALRDRKVGLLASGCAVAIFAATTRQNSAIVCVIAAIALARDRELRRQAPWWVGTLLPVVVGVWIHFWFQGRTDVRALKPAIPNPATLLALPYVAVHLMGLSAIPLLLLSPRPGSWKTLAVSIGIFAAWGYYWHLYGKGFPYGGLFPYAENMLTPHGAFAGSQTMGKLVVGDQPILLGERERVFLTSLGCLAGGALVERAARQGKMFWLNPLMLFALLQIPFLLAAPDIYDRYLLFLLPGALSLAISTPAAAEERGKRDPWEFGGWAALVVLTGLSIGLMHDWLSWNSARWELGRRAMAHQIRPEDIEGGFEWNGWSRSMVHDPDTRRPYNWPVLPFTAGWFPHVTGRFALSFSAVPGTRELDSEPYSVWLEGDRREFHLLAVPPLPPPDSKGTAPR